MSQLTVNFSAAELKALNAIALADLRYPDHTVRQLVRQEAARRGIKLEERSKRSAQETQNRTQAGANGGAVLANA